MEKKSQYSIIFNKNGDPKKNFYWNSCPPVRKYTGSVNFPHSSFYGRFVTKICDCGRFVTLLTTHKATVEQRLDGIKAFSFSHIPASEWRYTRSWQVKQLALAGQRDIPQQTTLWSAIKLREMKRKGVPVEFKLWHFCSSSAVRCVETLLYWNLSKDGK